MNCKELREELRIQVWPFHHNQGLALVVAQQPLRYGIAVAKVGFNPHNTPLLTDVPDPYEPLSELFGPLQVPRQSVHVLPISLVRPYPLALKPESRLV